MTKFELTEFLTWMTNHQPSSKQVIDEMYVHDVALVMQTVRDEFTRLQAERDEAWVDQRLIDELWERRTDAAEANERIQQLLGVSEQLLKERDEARRVLKAIVEEFVQHEQAMNQSYPATPKHECEFSWSPERGKCDACEAWGDYVLICHPLWETDEEETL